MPENTQIKFIVVFSFSLFLIFLNSCDFYYKNMPFVPIPHQMISGPIEVGSEWTEIIPPQPLKVLSSQPWITLGFLEYDSEKTELCSDTLYLKDGRTTKIEAVLTDDKGENYTFEICGLGGGVDLYRKRLTVTQDTKEFPTKVSFTKLRIKSEVPLKCDKIEWINSKPIG